MSNKIVFVHGSPRKDGNTRIVTAAAIEAAKEENAQVAEIDATQLEFKIPGCEGCLKCQHSEEFVCAIDDQVAQAVATLPEYNVIVMATPVYWLSFSAQIKILIDRMYSLDKPTGTPLAGKTLALLATGGGPLEDNLDILERQWKICAEWSKASFVSCLFPKAPSEPPGALGNDPSALEKAREFGRLLASAK